MSVARPEEGERRGQGRQTKNKPKEDSLMALSSGACRLWQLRGNAKTVYVLELGGPEQCVGGIAPSPMLIAMPAVLMVAKSGRP